MLAGLDGTRLTVVVLAARAFFSSAFFYNVFIFKMPKIQACI